MTRPQVPPWLGTPLGAEPTFRLRRVPRSRVLELVHAHHAKADTRRRQGWRANHNGLFIFSLSTVDFKKCRPVSVSPSTLANSDANSHLTPWQPGRRLDSWSLHPVSCGARSDLQLFSLVRPELRTRHQPNHTTANTVRGAFAIAFGVRSDLSPQKASEGGFAC